MNIGIDDTAHNPIRRTMLALLFGLALAACGGGGSSDAGNAPGAPPPSSPPAPPAQPLRVVPASINLDRSGSGQFLAVGTVANGNGAPTWTSSDPAVVTVDARGVLQATGRGTATVTATVTAPTGAVTSTATVRVFDTQAATPDSTSIALIAKALAEQRISAEEALVYRVFAAFGDERLPVAYQGAPSAESNTQLMREVSGQLPSLSADTRATLRPFFVPPIYAESWYAKRFGLDIASASVKGGQVRIHQASGGETCTLMTLGVRRRATAHFNVWTVEAMVVEPLALNPGALAAEQLAQKVADSLEEVYQAETSLLQRFPKNDIGEDCNGGDGAVDVYLTPLMSNDHPGETTPYPASRGPDPDPGRGGCAARSSFIKINYYLLANNTVPGQGGTPFFEKYSKGTLAHEFAHVLQFAMNRGADCANYDWIDEATAQWMRDYVYPSDDTEDGIEKVVPGRQRSGTVFANYLLNDHMAALENPGSANGAALNGYSDYIFFQYIARKHGAQVIRSIFDAMLVHDSVQALHAGVDSIGGMDRVWHDFALALWNDPNNPSLERLPDLYDFGLVHVFAGEGRAYSQRKPQTRPIELNGAGRAKFELLKTAAEFGSGGVTTRIEPRSVHYEHLTFTDATVSTVAVSLPANVSGLLREGTLKLRAVPKIEGQWKPVEDWTPPAQSPRFFCRDKRSERLEELILILSYSENVPASQAAVIAQDDPLMVSVSNVGCWKWQGGSLIRNTGDDGNVSSDNSARATEVVFEPPQELQGLTQRLTALSGSASGLATFVSRVPPCTTTLTGPAKTIVAADAGGIWFNLDLELPSMPPPDRKVGLLQAVKFIDSTQVTVCNGVTTTTPAPSTGWPWLNFPLVTNPLDVAADGRTIEANVMINVQGASTLHQFRFTAMRE